MGSHVFLLVTAGDCGHCKDFKDRSYDNVMRSLQSKGLNFRHVVIALTRRDMSINPDRFPVNIMKHVPGFPCLLMIRGSTWDHAMSNKTQRTTAIFSDDDVSVIDSRYDRNNPEDVAHWMQKAIDKFDGVGISVPRAVQIPGGYQVPIIYSSVGEKCTDTCGLKSLPKSRSRSRR